MSRAASNELDAYPFVRLAQSGLPPRVRGLLEGAFHAAQPIIDAGLERALDELDRDLLAHAERSASAGEQNQCVASLHEFRNRRSDFMLACRAGVQRSLLALVDPTVPDQMLHSASLGDDLAHPDAATAVAREEELTLSQIAARAEIRVGGELQALAYRLGVIAGMPPADIECLVLGPYNLCAAFRAAAQRFGVIPAHRLALYRRIDKSLFANPVALYDAINRYLISHRVFANLQISPASEKTAAAPATSVPAPAAALSSAPAPAPASVAGSERVAAPPTVPVTALPLPPASTPVIPVPLAHPSAPSPDPIRPARVDASQPLDDDFFRALRLKLAADRRAAQATGTDVHQDRPLVDPQDLQVALSALRSQALGPVMLGGKWANRTIAHIRQDLMNQLRSVRGGAPPKLRDEDAGTIDLVGLLFEQLQAAYPPNSMRSNLLSRLQIPLLKAALRDPGFFTQPHPARRFLDAMVDCLADWVDDEDADRHLIEKLQIIVDHLAREFDGDSASFDRCREELGRHLASMVKKAEVAERRHVDAAKGREKLDLARAAAQEVVASQLHRSNAPTAIRTLLETAWTDAVALTLLRQGIDHPNTSARVALVEQLLAVFSPGLSQDVRRAALDRLRNVLEEGLAAVGFHDDAIASAWSDICALADARQEHEQRAATLAITDLLRQKPRFGGDSAADGGVGEHPGSDGGEPAIDASQRAMIERIEGLPAGTWFEFVPDDGRGTSRRKLSWFSPLTGRCMLLNARGGKCEDMSVGQLARELLRDRARIAAADRERPVDRAWRAIRARALATQDSIAPRQLPSSP